VARDAACTKGKGRGCPRRRGPHAPAPYIRRRPDRRDALRYQTVYAVRGGSIAAPTAGLHFTAALLDRVRRRGIEIVRVTLHVGEGTFRPIRTRLLEDHRMQEEVFSITPRAAARIRAAGAGRPVIAVGTTCVRTLEGVVHETGAPRAWRDRPPSSSPRATPSASSTGC